jgi:hypothetical protein
MVIIPRNPHPGAPTHPFTPKVLKAKEHTQFLVLVVFTFGFVIESIQDLGVPHRPCSNEHQYNLVSHMGKEGPPNPKLALDLLLLDP